MSAKISSSILDNEQILSIWGNILKEIIPTNSKKDGEITVEEFAELAGISKDLARKKLKALENKGLVTRRWFVENKKRLFLYLPISE